MAESDTKAKYPDRIPSIVESEVGKRIYTNGTITHNPGYHGKRKRN